MTTIDIGKLKSTLEKSGIIITDYYTLEGKCAMLKAFVYGINQFLLIYIPTKFRAEIKAKKNLFELKLLDEVTDEEDYAKFDEFQIKYVHEKTDKDTYKNTAQKYNKQIVINGDGVEQFEKRITRQVKRLNIPFSKLSYTLGVQNKKIMALHFGEEINLFYIKNYMKDIRCYMYIVNVKELIDNITELHYELGNVNTQFFTIINDIIETNMGQISEIYKTNLEKVVEKFRKYRTEYAKKTDQFNISIKKIEDEEDVDVKKYKQLFLNETSTIKKNSLEVEYQNLVNSVEKKKYNSIEDMIEQTYTFQIYFLLLEEISFDNFIMLKRSFTNFEKLKNLFDV